MATVHQFNLYHLLVGTWRADEDDARSEYTISIEGGNANVTGCDFEDGEPYHISNVVLEKDAVAFDTFMASTGRRGHLRLKAIDQKNAEMIFTFTDMTRAVKVR